MCTLIVLDRMVPDFPVVAAANRDEFYGRPASGPQRLLDVPWIVGPRDEQAGGTWIGVGEGRLFAGLTNRPGGADNDPNRRSRGEVTLRALRAGTVEAVLADLGTLPPDRYNGFNLFCSGLDGACVVSYGDDSHGNNSKGNDSHGNDSHSYDGFVRRLSPGLHIVTNRGVNLLTEPKVARIRELIGDPEAITTVGGAIEILTRVLADHSGDELLNRVCIHSELYGSRASSLVALHETDPSRSIYQHTEGPSCKAPWKDVSELLWSATSWHVAGGSG